MIIDSFMFFNESEISFLRIKELYDHVDYFVVVEADTTHLGEKKPYVFFDNKLIERFKDKIIYEKITLTENNGWGKENENRKKIFNAINKNINIDNDDLILFSDCDEIPNFRIFDKIDKIKALNQLFFVFDYNIFSGKAVTGSIALRGNIFKEQFSGDYFQFLRNNKDNIPRIQNGGWHYSYMGGANKISKKATAIAEGKKSCFETSSTFFEQMIKTAKEEKTCPYSTEKLQIWDLENDEFYKKIKYLTCKNNHWFYEENFYNICIKSFRHE